MATQESLNDLEALALHVAQLTAIIAKQEQRIDLLEKGLFQEVQLVTRRK